MGPSCQGPTASAPLTHPALVSPDQAQGTPWQDHRKSHENYVRSWKHQLKLPQIQRGWRVPLEAQKLGRGKLFPATHVICSYLHFRSKILEVESKASARQKMVARISTQQLCLPTIGAALCKEQTQTDGAQDKVAMPGQTDLYLTAAAVTACGRRRGGSTHSPQKCTQLGKKRCFLQLSKRNQELIP